MTYDEHWNGGNPGAIASINWVNSVIKYAVTSIPKQKILLGLAAYGYDWGVNVKTKAYSVNQAYNVAKLYGSSISFDDIAKVPHYSYVSDGVTHSVWFENSQSIGYKIDLVNSYDLGGVAIWSLAQTNSDYWNTINLKLNK
jgi:spore germination protein YaaH